MILRRVGDELLLDREDGISSFQVGDRAGATETEKMNPFWPFAVTSCDWARPEEREEACPCCDYLSLEKRGYGETCLVCFWKDYFDDGDTSIDEKPDDPTARNDGLTLRQAQKNFDSVGACSPEMKRFVLPANIVRGMKRSERAR